MARKKKSPIWKDGGTKATNSLDGTKEKRSTWNKVPVEKRGEFFGGSFSRGKKLQWKVNN